MLNPIWMRTFITLIETGHFTQTAERLNMTQPGVSQHIKKLEEACGHPLLVRDKKRFETTPQGRLLYQYALEQAESEKRLLDHLSNDKADQGECRVACSGTLALQIYPELLQFQKEHPKLSVHLEAAPSQRILEQITSNQVELGIVVEEPNPIQFESIPLTPEPLALILPREAKMEHLPLNEVLNELGLIHHPDLKHYLVQFVTNVTTQESQYIRLDQIPSRGYINQIHQILLPVANGIGCTVLPKRALTLFPLRDKLVEYKTKSPVTEPLYLVKKRHRPLAARYEVIATLIEGILNNGESRI